MRQLWLRFLVHGHEVITFSIKDLNAYADDPSGLMSILERQPLDLICFSIPVENWFDIWFHYRAHLFFKIYH
jgi:hypothetical protein